MNYMKKCARHFLNLKTSFSWDDPIISTAKWVVPYKQGTFVVFIPIRGKKMFSLIKSISFDIHGKVVKKGRKCDTTLDLFPTKLQKKLSHSTFYVNQVFRNKYLLKSHFYHKCGRPRFCLNLLLYLSKMASSFVASVYEGTSLPTTPPLSEREERILFQDGGIGYLPLLKIPLISL